MPQRLRYAGYWYDQELGWYWVSVRSYDPSLKLWLQPDPSQTEGEHTFHCYVPLTALVITLGWLAATGQLTALLAGRYAPYPTVAERAPRGPLREAVRHVVLARRARLRASEETRRALEG